MNIEINEQEMILKSIKKVDQPFYSAKRVGFWTCFALIGAKQSSAQPGALQLKTSTF